MRIQEIAKMAVLLAAMGIAAGGTSAFANIDLGTATASGTGADGQTISASVDFQIVGGQLQVTLKNTFSGDTFGVAETLYGLSFNGASGLSLVSAVAPVGDTEWNIQSHSSASSSAVTSPLSVSWLGNLTGVSAIGSGQPVDGVLSAGFSAPPSSDGLSAHDPYFQNALVFLFNYTSLDSISDVKFRYGTSAETTITSSSVIPVPVPEAGTVLAGALLLLPIGASTLRILRKSRTA